MIHVNPLTWHSVACTIFWDCALEELKKAKAEETVPSNWPSFKAWITGENPLAISKRLVARKWNQLCQGANESLEKFMAQFSAWQAVAKNYDFLCNECTGFVLKVNPGIVQMLGQFNGSRGAPGKTDGFLCHSVSSSGQGSTMRTKSKSPTFHSSKSILHKKIKKKKYFHYYQSLYHHCFSLYQVHSTLPLHSYPLLPSFPFYTPLKTSKNWVFMLPPAQ